VCVRLNYKEWEEEGDTMGALLFSGKNERGGGSSGAPFRNSRGLIPFFLLRSFNFVL